MTRGALGTASAALVLAVGCRGPQSALDPGGREAAQLADLFWLMTWGSAVVWLASVGLAVYAAYVPRAPISTDAANRLVVVFGAVIPTLVLGALLVHGLGMIPGLLAPAPRGALEIEVVGEQWWWRVRHRDADGRIVESANELRLPAGVPVQLSLETRDVIHAFWIPALGGKVDMIPGRRTQLRLEPTRPGVYRGVCAEYCGTSHTWMAFAAIVETQRDHEAWLAHELGDALEPTTAIARRGASLFLENGCSACHAIRGTAADGTVGPDLTHVGSRHTIGAGRLDRGPEALRRWIADPERLKSGVHMPAFEMLPGDELDALAAYLESLR
ncbi:cytochrome c oxidase subunit II [Sandaracinus amylolyticus]|uniref:cytochrome c oxidase subunit II n=1 Tax=Sandaracinus amylolyticus TaxID=927083 RepID=UPI0009F8D27B|nr:cytochrome c oxidase subunit II [Sandaracinus amylolyticus]